MTSPRGIVEGLLIAAAMISAAPAMSKVSPADRLAATADLFGARIDMTRAELMTHTPAKTIDEDRCTTSPSDDPRLLFLECGAYKLTVDFTDAGTVWQLRASYDFTDTPLSIADARAALVSRYGVPTVTNAGGSLAWLPPGTPAAKAGFCAGGAMLLAAEIEIAGRPGALARPPPALDPHCAPTRSAILAERSGHRGVIVDIQDVRPRLAELGRQRGKPVQGRR